MIEVCLVGRTATLGDEEELIVIPLCGMDLNLSGEVAAGVDFFIHRQRCVLRVAEVILGVGLVYSEGNLLLIVASCPDVLSFVGGADRCAGILAERKHTLAGHLCIAQHCQGHELVVFRGLRVVENLGHHLIVLSAKHE